MEMRTLVKVDWVAYSCSALLGGIALASAAQPASSSITDDTPVALGLFIASCGAVALIAWRLGVFVTMTSEQRLSIERANKSLSERLDSFDARLTSLAESVADVRIALRAHVGKCRESSHNE